MAELAPAAAQGDFLLGFEGDSFNTVWSLARLRADFDVSFLTGIGDDMISRQMRVAIVAGGIGDSYVQVVPDRTASLYLISLKNGERSFSYWRVQWMRLM